MELVFSLKIDLEGDVIHRAISDGIDILKDEFKIWSRKGKLDIYRHAFTLLAPKVRNMRIDQPKYLDSRNYVVNLMVCYDTKKLLIIS